MAGYEEELLVLTDKWVSELIDSLVETATESYAAGTMHAMTMLNSGISFEIVSHDAMAFAEKYRKRLEEEGVITVTDIIKDDAGKITGFRTRDVNWLGNKSVNIRNSILDVIIEGMKQGKPTGVRVQPNGRYPEGSIAADLQNLTDDYKSQASTIARTETARCYYNGETERYARAGVQYVKYLGQSGACEDCVPFIDNVYVLGSEPHHPMHPNCRCDYAPYFPKVGEVLNCGDGKTYIHTRMEDGTEKPVFVCNTDNLYV